jgi:hypothetical protein
VIAGTMVACRVSRAPNLAEKLSDLPWEESSVLEAVKKIELAFFAGNVKTSLRGEELRKHLSQLSQL